MLWKDYELRKRKMIFEGNSSLILIKYIIKRKVVDGFRKVKSCWFISVRFLSSVKFGTNYITKYKKTWKGWLEKTFIL